MRRSLLLLLVVGFLLAPSAAWAAGNPLGVDPAAAKEFQPYYGGSTSSSGIQHYRVQWTPLSTNNAPEILDFGCNYPPGSGVYSGQPVPGSALVFLKAEFSELRDKDGDDNDYNDIQESEGTDAAAAWLSGQTRELKNSSSTPAGAKPLITVTGDIGALTSAVPFGCGLGELDNIPSADQLTFGNLVRHTDRFITSLVLFIPGDITKAVYEVVEPRALAYTFWTPHSERGDLMFVSAGFACKGTPTTYNPETKKDEDVLSDAQRQALRQAQADSCNASGQALGFTRSNNNATEAPKWVKLSLFFQWLLGATYFVILAGGAIIYMSRATHRSSYTVVTMAPRLLLSIGITVLLTWLMGSAITLSNLFVQSLFSMQDVGSIRGIKEIFFQVGDIFGINTIGGGVMQIALMAMATYYLVRFLLFALWRQLALILLIVVAPFAAFCLIHPNLQHHFGRFVRAFAAILAAPWIMALILKLGLAINPAVGRYAEGGNSVVTPLDNVTSTIFGALLLLITFHAMVRVQKLMKAAAKGQPVSAGLMGRAGKLTKGLAPVAGIIGTPLAGAAVGALGSGMSAAGGASDRVNRGMAALIPDQKTRTTLRAPAGKPSMFQRLADSELAGGVAGKPGEAAAAKALGFGAKALESAEAARGEGGFKGGVKALPAALLGAGALAAGGVIGGQFGGNNRTQQSFRQFQRAQITSRGLKEITVAKAMKMLDEQNRAMAAARSEAEGAGREFNEDAWLQKWWEDGGPRLIQKVVAGQRLWFQASRWSKDRPMADHDSVAAPGPRYPTAEDVDFEVGSFGATVPPAPHWSPPVTPAAPPPAPPVERRAPGRRHASVVTRERERRLDLRGFSPGSVEARGIRLGVEQGFLDYKKIMESTPGLSEEEAKYAYENLRLAGVVREDGNVDASKVREAFGAENFGVEARG